MLRVMKKNKNSESIKTGGRNQYIINPINRYLQLLWCICCKLFLWYNKHAI